MEQNKSKEDASESKHFKPTVEKNIESLKNFVLDRVLSENSEKKCIFLLGHFDDDKTPSIVILEQEPFCENKLSQIFRNSILKKEFSNDIYSRSALYAAQETCGIKTTIILSATEKHIKKYEYQPFHLIEETPELYESVTLPFLKTEQFGLNWLYNILDHKAETDRIVFEDPDPVNGFTLIYNLTWDGESMETFYLAALVNSRDILSLRDLSAEHLPLLKNIYNKSVEAIFEKYKIPKTQLRVYFHYQPTYYHLHVHFNCLKFNPPGINVERSHMLTTVINNIELVPDYYKKATIPFIIKESDNLFGKFEEKGLVKKLGV